MGSLVRYGESSLIFIFPYLTCLEARMSLAATLDSVHFEWVGDRSVKLKIRESTLTFST